MLRDMPFNEEPENELEPKLSYPIKKNTVYKNKEDNFNSFQEEVQFLFNQLEEFRKI
jgi:hypothetical protein